MPEVKQAAAHVDIVIVGAGIAGLFAAWQAAKAGLRVIVLTKGDQTDSNTYHAQGGIAAALHPDDTPAAHAADTLQAGAGACLPERVEMVTTEGCACVAELIDLGVPFDRENGMLAFTREGGHGRARVVHAGGDATGAAVVRTLWRNLSEAPNVRLATQQQVLELWVVDGVCRGVIVWNHINGERYVLTGQAVLLATGGAGQVFRRTTNPAGATGDGISMAYQAGAAVTDLEFVQFHPTALAVAGKPCFLISEAVRGEGAWLRTENGRRFMPDYHPMAELAPRDIVTRAICREMQRQDGRPVWLDAARLPAQQLTQRFPNIRAMCQAYGLNIYTDYLPVAPAAHYLMGGIATDCWGETSLTRLFAVGETACTGVHGANRLASNSLLEGLVFGKRAVSRYLARYQARRLAPRPLPYLASPPATLVPPERLTAVQALMENCFGPLREPVAMQQGLMGLREWRSEWPGGGSPAAWMLRHLQTTAWLIAEAAWRRQESRGGHYRSDYPTPAAHWQTLPQPLAQEGGIHYA